MPGGSYSQNPIPEKPTWAPIPARATRHLLTTGKHRSVGEVAEDGETVPRRLQEIHPARWQTYTSIPIIHGPIHQYEMHPLRRHRSLLVSFIISIVCGLVGTFILVLIMPNINISYIEVVSLFDKLRMTIVLVGLDPFVIAASVLVGLIGSLITIYDFFRKGERRKNSR